MHGRAFASRRSAFPRNPSRFPECRDTIKGFAFGIRYLHGVMQNIKGFAFVILFRMDHAIIFKGTRSSVAAPHPFEIPLLAFLSRIPRTGFLPDAADARVVSDCVGHFRVFFLFIHILRLHSFFITHPLPRLLINGSLCLFVFQ